MTQLRIVAETGSTNADILATLSGGEHWPEGRWLVADRQVAGRGRQGRAWFDGAGNFMGSTVVHSAPGDPPAHTLSLLAGVALYETLLPTLSDPSQLMLKWPNDVLLRRAKLAGILLERAGDATVVGIGVNLRAAPDLPDRKTVALSDHAPPPPRDSFAQSLADSFATELERWRTYRLDPLLRRWQAAATPPDTQLTVHEPGGALVSGRYAGLAADGSLLLRLDNGERRAIHAGDVSLT